MTEKCRNVGELTVGGRVVGLIRCELDAGHDVETPADHAFGVTWYPKIEATPHRATLEWAIEGEGVNLIDWPEANDPDERFDVEVPVDQTFVDNALDQLSTYRCADPRCGCIDADPR